MYNRYINVRQLTYHMMTMQVTYNIHNQYIALQFTLAIITKESIKIINHNKNHNSLSLMITSKLIITALLIILMLNNTQVKQWLM